MRALDDEARAAHEERMREVLGGDVMPQRAAMFGEGGALARAMRANEAREWPDGWLREVWLWVLWLRVVRGFRGATTVAAYAGILGRYADWVSANDVDYRDVQLAKLDEWQKSTFIARRNSSASRRQQIAAVRSYYDWRKTRGLGRDCTEGLAGPRKVQRTPKVYTRQQLRALFEAASHGDPLTALRNRVMLLVLLTTGMRREEVATLKLDQLEIENNTGIVHVWGKGAKERDVPIEGPVVRELQAWLNERGKLADIVTDAVFITTRRNWWGQEMKPQAVERAVKSVARAARLPTWGTHRFRVTFATQLYDDGADIERIRIVMGHETIETTRRYLVVSKRMRDVRLKPHRQHDVLGTRPVGLPKWAEHLNATKSGGER